MTQRVFGIDVSKWNGVVDWYKASSGGVSFAFIKASQFQKDVRFDENWQNTRLAGIPRGAYHFLDWSFSEVTQANMFSDILIKATPSNLPPILDLEQYPKGETYNVTEEEMQERTWNFLQIVEEKTKMVPMIYSGYYYWNAWMSEDEKWKKYPFWLAWYSSESVVKVPKPWDKWTFWQYTDSGTGPQYGTQSEEVDMNYFYGTYAELEKFFINPIAPPIPPQTTNVYVTNVSVNVRKGPNPTDPIIGVIYKGTNVIVDGQISGERTHIITPMNGWVWSAYLTPVYTPTFKTCPTCNGTGKVPA